MFDSGTAAALANRRPPAAAPIENKSLREIRGVGTRIA
jgi:hypothetical protein